MPSSAAMVARQWRSRTEAIVFDEGGPRDSQEWWHTRTPFDALKLLDLSVKCFYWNALALGLIWRLRDLRRGGRADSESAYAVFTGWVAGLIPVVYTQVSTLF